MHNFNFAFQSGGMRLLLFSKAGDIIWGWPGKEARLLGSPNLIRGGLSLHWRQHREVFIKQKQLIRILYKLHASLNIRM